MVTVAPSTVAPVPVTWAESPFSFIVALYEADEQAYIRHSAPASVSAEKIAIILVFFNVTTSFTASPGLPPGKDLYSNCRFGSAAYR